jgi:hypothetical protein
MHIVALSFLVKMSLERAKISCIYVIICEVPIKKYNKVI